MTPDSNTPSMWETTFHLRCGHSKPMGQYPDLVAVERVTPRRKDASFGATYCETCRRKRRIASTASSMEYAW